MLRLAALLPLVLLSASPAAPEPLGPINPEQAQSLRWMRSQMVPNEIFRTPQPGRRGLILSYSPEKGQPPGPVDHKSFLYDVSLAAIAFTLTGESGVASRLLNAMVRVQRKNGSYWFSYNVHNGWPDEKDHEMALVRTGAIAWAGYALSFYLENKSPGESRFERRRHTRYLASAERAADFLLGLRAKDPPRLRGLIQGGRGQVSLHLDADKKGVVEVYEDRPIRWISTENNISSYFFLRALHRLTENARYGDAAQKIREQLVAALWVDDLGQFARGIKEDGELDRVMALDCASWGSLFLISIGEKEKALRAVKTADRNYQNEHRGIRGHRPYSNERIYMDSDVQRLFLPGSPEADWKDLSFVWSEGSFGVALAHLRLGHAKRSQEILAEVLKMRTAGSIRYASRELPYQFSRSASVAGTAWHLILEGALTEPRAQGFWQR